MIEHDFPLITRLTLFALGAVEGGRVRTPIDPVSSWLLHQRSALVPDTGALAALSTIRARTHVVDRMLLDELHRARALGEHLCVWTIGGGFDARWYRFASWFGEVITEAREVEEPGLLRFKDKVLKDSPFGIQWAQVRRRPKTMDGWLARPRTGCRPLVILEGLAGRMSPDPLRRLLQRLRYEVPDARLLLGLPGRPRSEGDQWSTFKIRHLGYQTIEDVNLGPRGRLLTPEGDEMCPGMYPVRVVRLAGKKV